MTLHQLLLAIQDQRPVNFAQVIKKLPATIHWQSLFSAELVSANKHLVTIKDNAQFELLLTQSTPATNRVSAAAHAFQDSHDAQCSTTYMLCFPNPTLPAPSAPITGTEIAPNTTSLPSIVLSHRADPAAKSGIESALEPSPEPTPEPHLQLDFTPQANAILIENQECFFRWRDLLSVLAIPATLANADIYFAGGKRTLNPLFAPLLSQYDTLYCAFDYDLVGLQMMQQLKQSYQGQTHYLMPNDLAHIAHLFTFAAKDISTLDQMMQLANHAGFSELATTIATTKHFMEQEALLNLVKSA